MYVFKVCYQSDHYDVFEHTIHKTKKGAYYEIRHLVLLKYNRWQQHRIKYGKKRDRYDKPEQTNEDTHHFISKVMIKP